MAGAAALSYNRTLNRNQPLRWRQTAHSCAASPKSKISESCIQVSCMSSPWCCHDALPCRHCRQLLACTVQGCHGSCCAEAKTQNTPFFVFSRFLYLYLSPSIHVMSPPIRKATPTKNRTQNTFCFKSYVAHASFLASLLPSWRRKIPRTSISCKSQRAPFQFPSVRTF